MGMNSSSSSSSPPLLLATIGRAIGRWGAFIHKHDDKYKSNYLFPLRFKHKDFSCRLDLLIQQNRHQNLDLTRHQIFDLTRHQIFDSTSTNFITPQFQNHHATKDCSRFPRRKRRNPGDRQRDSPNSTKNSRTSPS
jgi:hypothetical protein